MNSADKLIDNGTIVVNGNAIPRGNLLGMTKTIEFNANGDHWLSATNDARDVAGNTNGSSKPLNALMGAGQLNAARAITQFQSGRQSPGQVNPLPLVGWDYNDVGAGVETEKIYTLNNLRGNSFISLTLTWDRIVSRQMPTNAFTAPSVDDFYDPSPLDDLELQLIRKVNGGPDVVEWTSQSTVDNTEHIFFLLPQDGDYEVKVKKNAVVGGQQRVEYALAWWAVRMNQGNGGSIGNTMFEDENGDDEMNVGETGVEGVFVHLYSEAGDYLATTSTDAMGEYQFTDLAAGNYYIKVESKDGYRFSGKDGASDSVDSDVDAAGYSDLIEVACDEDVENVWVGLVPLGSVSGTVWSDNDDDGIRDVSDHGMEGIVVSLYSDADELLDMTLSESDGTYRFKNLSTGDYYVVFSTPANVDVASQDVGIDDEIDSDANSLGQTAAFAVSEGEAISHIDVGLLTVYVTGIDVSSGQVTGGRMVTISGSGFLATTISAVEFGGVAAPYYHVESDTEISVLTPAHGDGVVDIVVKWADESQATVLASAYTYYDLYVTVATTPGATLDDESITCVVALGDLAGSVADDYVNVYVNGDYADGGSPGGIYTDVYRRVLLDGGMKEFEIEGLPAGIHEILAVFETTGVPFYARTAGVTHVVRGTPEITSDDYATFAIGVPDDFTITTTGFPDAKITIEGDLPPGFEWEDNGDGTATIAGTAEAGYGGEYVLTVTATNGANVPAIQELALSVSEAPSFLNSAKAAFYVGTEKSFTIVAMGFPAAEITKTGSLPAGLILTDNNDGTATISGTPEAATEGTYTIYLTADNDIGSNATQTLTIVVGQLLVVDSEADPSTLTAGTLRYAIDQANGFANYGINSTIIFEDEVATVTLSQGQLELSGNHWTTVSINIYGDVIVDGDGGSRVFHVGSRVHAAIAGLTITNGDAASGGGIFNSGTLELVRVKVINNSADLVVDELSGFGGGIFNDSGWITIVDSEISENVAAAGGGIANFGSVTVATSVISENTGGGVYSDGVLVIVGTTFAENGGNFGGIANDINGNVVVFDSAFANNETTSAGGGLANWGSAQVFNSTFAGNIADEFGGAIYNYNYLSVAHCTIVGNSVTQGSGRKGGGIYADYWPVSISNTIVALNTSDDGNEADDLDGDYSGFANLIGEVTGVTGLSDGVDGNIVGATEGEIAIGALANNGGPTQTMALLAESLALGAGMVAVLDASIDSDDTTLSVDDAHLLGVAAGDIIQIGDELMRVMSIDLWGNELTVERGYQGSTATSHSSSAAVSRAFDQRGTSRLRSGLLDIGAYQQH